MAALGGRDSHASGLNDRGQVIGQLDVGMPGEPPANLGDPDPPNDRAYHAFLHEDGTMWDLGSLGGKDGEAMAIHACGQVVGWSLPETGVLPPAPCPASHAIIP